MAICRCKTAKPDATVMVRCISLFAINFLNQKVTKSLPLYENSISLPLIWRRSREQGYFYTLRLTEVKTAADYSSKSCRQHLLNPFLSEGFNHSFFSQFSRCFSATRCCFCFLFLFFFRKTICLRGSFIC